MIAAEHIMVQLLSTEEAFQVHVDDVILIRSVLDNSGMYGECYIMLDAQRQLLWEDMGQVINQR